jgi:hypothetical protein
MLTKTWEYYPERMEKDNWNIKKDAVLKNFGARTGFSQTLA